LADEHARLASVAGQMARSFAAAAASENRLARTLIELEPLGYTLLADRRWPGSSRANVDLILVGPGGVIIVDAKSWRDVTVAAGHVFRGEADVTDEIEQLADLVFRAQTGLAEIGLAAGEISAMAVFTNKVLPRAELFGVTMLGEAAAVTEIARRGTRLNAEQIAKVRTELDRLFPPMTTGPIDVIVAPDTSVPEPVLPADIQASSLVDFSSLDKLTSQQIQDAWSRASARRRSRSGWPSSTPPRPASCAGTSTDPRASAVRRERARPSWPCTAPPTSPAS